MVSAQQLSLLLPNAPQEDLLEICEPLNKAMAEFSIDNTARQAMFIAQCAHESGNFTTVEENLNYSADGLTKIFSKYFRDVDPNEYAHNPAKIANRVYANRMGNGDESSGDGYRFRGRGLIQLTGKSNYQACSAALNVDLIASPDYLETAEGASRSAAWFWAHNNLNQFADADDIVGCTKRVNGGTIGLEDRTRIYESAKTILS